MQQSLLGQHFFASVQQVAWEPLHINILLGGMFIGKQYVNLRSQRSYFQMLQIKRRSVLFEYLPDHSNLRLDRNSLQMKSYLLRRDEIHVMQNQSRFLDEIC